MFLDQFHLYIFSLISDFNTWDILLSIQSDKGISLQSLVTWNIIQSDQLKLKCETLDMGYLVQQPMELKTPGFYISKCGQGVH